MSGGQVMVDRPYRAYLAYTVACQRCRTSHVLCPDGARLRRDWRARR